MTTIARRPVWRAKLAVLALLLLCSASLQAPPAQALTQPTRLRITNQCKYDLWVEQAYQHATSQSEIVVSIPQATSHDYHVPDAGLASTRFWAKANCNQWGWDCGIGESQAVPSTVSGGHQTTMTAFDSPIDSKFEATWGCLLSNPSQCARNPSNGQPLDATTSWNASAVDGYTFAFKIVVKNDPNSTCEDQTSQHQVTQLDCSGLDPTSCSADNLSSGGVFNPINGVQVTSVPLVYNAFSDGTTVIGCFSPCSLLTSGQWMGWMNKLGGLTPQSDQAQMYCCPTRAGASWSVSSTQCSTTGKTIDGHIVPAVAPQTNYVASVHKVCNAYAYAYDDTIGLVNCAASVQYELIFCPGGNALPLAPQRVPTTFCDSTNPTSKCPGGGPCPSTPAACGTNPQMCKCPPSP